MQRLLRIKDLLARRQYAQALLQCESLIQETGGRGEVALMTARSLVGLARLQEAETWVQRARADLPDETVALRLLAQIYRRRGWRVRAQAIERRLAPPEDRTPLSAESRAPVRSETEPDPTPRMQRAVPGRRPVEPPITASMEAPRDRVPSMEPASGVSDSTPPSPPPAHSSSRRTPIPGPLPTAPSGTGATASMSLPKLASSSLLDFPAYRPPPATEPSRETPEGAPRKPSPSTPPTPAAEPSAKPEPAVAGPDPLGLISVEKAQNQRSLVEQGERPALDEPLAPRPTAAAPVEESETPPVPPPQPSEGATASWTEEQPARGVYLDTYTARRKRSRFVIAVGVIGIITVLVAAIVVVRVWRKEQLARVLYQTQRHIDDADYEGLKEARAAIRGVLGESSKPDPVLTARESQVELYLWMFYTGERAYLQQARVMLEDSEMRDPHGDETRFTRALWEGYLGDPSITVTIAGDLEDGSALRADRIHLLRGVAASSMGDHGRAARHLEKAVSLAPTCLNHLAFAREAERYGNLPDAQDQHEAILEIRPDHTVAKVDLALLRAGMPTERGYLEAVEAVQQEHNGKVPPRVMSRVLVARARGYAAAGEPQDAAESFNQALAEDGDNPDVLLAYGHELRVWGDLTDARATLAQIERHQPYSGDALGELGLIAFLQDRPGFLEEKLAAFPAGARRGASYLLASGLHDRMTGDTEGAVEQLARTPPEMWGGEARLLLAEAQLEAKQYEDARTTVEEARELVIRYRGAKDPLVSVADLVAARVDAGAGRRPDSDRVHRAVRRHKRYPIVLFTAARLAEEQGRRDEAARLYCRSFERGQDFSLALVGFVGTSRPADELVPAAARAYLRISPDGPHAAEMEKNVPR